MKHKIFFLPLLIVFFPIASFASEHTTKQNKIPQLRTIIVTKIFKSWFYDPTFEYPIETHEDFIPFRNRMIAFKVTKKAEFESYEKKFFNHTYPPDSETPWKLGYIEIPNNNFYWYWHKVTTANVKTTNNRITIGNLDLNKIDLFMRHATQEEKVNLRAEINKNPNPFKGHFENRKIALEMLDETYIRPTSTPMGFPNQGL